MYLHPNAQNHLAFNAEARADDSVAALCFELPLGDSGALPEWIEIIPAGSTVRGRDNRSWQNPDPRAVISETQSRRVDVVVDWEHSTELKAPHGDAAPAAGWLTDWDLRAGAIWARVQWTESGGKSVSSREYRYLSAVFKYNPATGEIRFIKSVGLTNSPNLYVSALNRENQPKAPEETTMDLAKILAALRLSADASADQILTAINQIQQERDTALNQSKTPDLSLFVPRGDYDAALARASNAEQALADRDATALNQQIDTAINQALESGKITPGTAEYHRQQCGTEGGLERFRQFVDAAPAIAPPSKLPATPPSGGETALNREQTQIAGIFGNTAEDLENYS